MLNYFLESPILQVYAAATVSAFVVGAVLQSLVDSFKNRNKK